MQHSWYTTTAWQMTEMTDMTEIVKAVVLPLLGPEARAQAAERRAQAAEKRAAAAELANSALVERIRRFTELTVEAQEMAFSAHCFGLTQDADGNSITAQIGNRLEEALAEVEDDEEDEEDLFGLPGDPALEIENWYPEEDGDNEGGGDWVEVFSVDPHGEGWRYTTGTHEGFVEEQGGRVLSWTQAPGGPFELTELPGRRLVHRLREGPRCLKVLPTAS